MRKRLFRYVLPLLGVGFVGTAFFLFMFIRPVPVEIARPAENVPVKVFGLGTVEARIASEIGGGKNGGSRCWQGAGRSCPEEADKQAQTGAVCPADSVD